MEQLDIFEMDLTRVQQFFSHHSLVPTLGERYVVKVKKCRPNDREGIDASFAIGRLIRFDDTGIALGDAWVSANDGYHSNYVTVALKDISGIAYYRELELEFGKPYRAEILRPNGNKPTTWLSCYYMGMTMSDHVLLVDFGNANNILCLPRDGVKGMYPLALEDMPTNEVEVSAT